ncbi:MAG: hypothetical protein IPO43_12665 [Rhodoferax sp.]|nr:hypothetical protein [Rhodoferax sp.]
MHFIEHQRIRVQRLDVRHHGGQARRHQEVRCVTAEIDLKAPPRRLLAQQSKPEGKNYGFVEPEPVAVGQ